MTTLPTLSDIYAARKRVAPYIRRTPLIYSEALSQIAGEKVYLKLESLQLTGSFKARGAANKLLSLTPEEKAKGVIAFSTGNHGRAVSYIGRELGISVTICLSQRVPKYRVEGMRALGAEVVACGQSQDEAYEKALELQNDGGLTMVAPFDDSEVLCGQGTMALEILEELPEAGSIIVPLSGGGLFSGVALAAKTVSPSLKMTGVSMEVAPAMIRSLEAGKPIEIPEVDSLADALLGGIGLDNKYTFELTRRYIDCRLLSPEPLIAKAMAHALMKERLCLEGSGAVGLAAILAGLPPEAKTKGRPLVVICSGGNVDMELLIKLANDED
ncbi:MAG: threonine/serine dehydratase [Deltaproteobacteria bacterium]|jgi:threonine dehydratase|nr:threonine/serine dehydratase [Deltaproteobacteria bacterium]